MRRAALPVAVAAFVALMALAGAMGAVAGTGTPSTLTGFQPSAGAVGDIPSELLPVYMAAADRFGLDWTILAAIGKIETDHCRSTSPGVHSGTNFAGAMGCMQFLAGTWAGYGAGGNPYDPADAIPAAARYLKASGAPGDYHRAILAYNHSGAYLADVLAQAERYRGAATAADLGGRPPDGTAQDVLSNPRITLRPCQRQDVQTREDPRVVSMLAWLGQHHSIIVTALKCDHFPGTNHNPSDGSPGRAIDIGAVDGQICTGTPDGACGRLAVELAAIEGPMRSTELIYCFDPDGPADPRGFARADHCNHVHVGWDA